MSLNVKSLDPNDLKARAISYFYNFSNPTPNNISSLFCLKLLGYFSDNTGSQEFVLSLRDMSKFKGLLGGKGGFGSLLRSIKAKSQPTDNMDACRDLETGRRMGQI